MKSAKNIVEATWWPNLQIVKRNGARMCCFSPLLRLLSLSLCFEALFVCLLFICDDTYMCVYSSIVLCVCVRCVCDVQVVEFSADRRCLGAVGYLFGGEMIGDREVLTTCRFIGGYCKE